MPLNTTGSDCRGKSIYVVCHHLCTFGTGTEKDSLPFVVRSLQLFHKWHTILYCTSGRRHLSSTRANLNGASIYTGRAVCVERSRVGRYVSILAPLGYNLGTHNLCKTRATSDTEQISQLELVRSSLSPSSPLSVNCCPTVGPAPHLLSSSSPLLQARRFRDKVCTVLYCILRALLCSTLLVPLLLSLDTYNLLLVPTSWMSLYRPLVSLFQQFTRPTKLYSTVFPASLTPQLTFTSASLL